MRVGFLGPAGTYSQEAMFAWPGSENYEPVPLPSVHDAVMAVHERRVERALVPIENSLEGAVNATLDALAFETDDVQITGELVHAIHHCLIAREPVELERIAAVASHPQASGQCATFLRTRLARASVVTAASTADAVRLVAEREDGEPWAALGSRAAAELYGCAVLASDVEDPPGSETRFVWIGREAPDPSAGGAWKTALMFWEPSDDRPGWLVRCLDRVRRARGQPHPHRVAPAAARAGDVHVLRRRRRPRGRSGRGPGDRCAALPCGRRAGARLVPVGAIATLRQVMATAVPPGPLGSVPPGDHPRHGPSPDGAGRWSGGRVLVLNATYEPINVCTVRRATVLLLKEKAEVIEIGSQTLHWANGSLAKPVVIRLITYVKIPRDTHKRKITRRAVFARDGWACQYCGARTSLTVDHVIPRSKGGTSGWDNIVASCAPCNRRKGDRLPHQVDMHPRNKPRIPSPHIFIQLSSPTIPATWKQYLLHEAA